MTVNVAVIGAGMMGSDHVRRLATKIAGARVGAIVDVDLERAGDLATEIARAHGGGDVVVSDDPYATISNPAVDAIIIATGDDTHAPLCLAALDRGIPVLCEKPLAPTEAECRQVVDREIAHVAAGGHRLISVGFMRRFDPGCVELRAAVESQEHGPALITHCLHRNVAPYPGGSDHTITGSAVHEFDFIPWLLGDPIAEVAWLGSRSSGRTTRRDPQLLLIRTADDVLTTLEMFVSASYGYEVGCEVVFERATLSLANPTAVTRRAGRALGYELPKDSIPRYIAAYDVEVQAWIDSVIRDETPDARLASAWDGLLATRAANRMVEAMEAGDGRFLAVDPLIAPEIYL
ncbi:MAG: Gfo/Idh/MocA family oxidoreductase [Tessaracoccus sp.]|uniref:Gfo/Idh/MocA family oxidoreductase n=1 Tax=Tessaracoccus sp. TaxID=1971211 RepID=UPI001EBB7F7E|nr:Gfo/Idh/MocA family oxidoreductase [Tessaracoccus sp.]MBK7819771.1 Gfo/Idh/MocA family oxidoreductase [Tessaracoccus sp.]